MSCNCSNGNGDNSSCCTKKNSPKGKWIAVAAVIMIAGLIIYSKQTSKNDVSNSALQNSAQTSSVAQAKALPTLIELGAEKCVPCRMMKPIIDDLEANYKKSLNVVFYDVWKNPETGRKFKIQIIPVQIFLDGNGNELFRHEGFFSKEDILSKWKELGYDMTN